MRGFLGLMKSEAIRLRHTALFWMHLVLPAAGAAIFLWYYSFSDWESSGKVQAYLQVVACVWPFLCGVVCGLSEEMEADCGYQNFFTLPERKSQALLSKWCVLLLAGLFACLIAVMGFAFVYRLYPDGNIYSIPVYLGAAAVIWLAQAVVYLIHLVLALLFGKSISIGGGILGSLCAFLMLTGLGDGIWIAFPWAWSGRICTYLLLYMSGKGSGLSVDPAIRTELWICLAVFVILAAVAFLWFLRYEGRRADPE